MIILKHIFLYSRYILIPLAMERAKWENLQRVPNVCVLAPTDWPVVRSHLDNGRLSFERIYMFSFLPRNISKVVIFKPLCYKPHSQCWRRKEHKSPLLWISDNCGMDLRWFPSDTGIWPHGSVQCSRHPGHKRWHKGRHTGSPCTPSEVHSLGSRHILPEQSAIIMSILI